MMQLLEIIDHMMQLSVQNSLPQLSDHVVLAAERKEQIY